MDLEEIKSRINPQYQDVLGTESYERKWLCDEIERLRKDLDLYKMLHDGAHEFRADAEEEAINAEEKLAACQKERDELVETLDKLARLGNEPHYGNSVGNQIAQAALAKLGADKTGEV